MSLRRHTGRGPFLALALLLALGAWNCASAEGAAGSAKKPARSACDRAAFRVVVDVGHTAKVPGASSPASAGLGSVQNNASSAPLLAFLLAAVVLTLGGYVGLRAWRNAAARKGAEPPGSEPPQLPPPTT